MKFIRLLLHAFGPFTNAEINFTPDDDYSGGNLHLIYGLNEAGKSSALRAMMDLRFGIPLRSPDDFLHLSKDLCIAGVFVGADGGPVGLVRRKGRKSTLSVFDPVVSGLDAAVEAGREHELALTGGLERGEFEAMFGLNHARLREGGDRLVKGEGELGSALFEASSGTRGINAILTSLDDDAKTFFSPRSKAAVINEARRTLDEHRKVCKEAQTRPAEWQELNRAHERTRDLLAEIDMGLEAARRHENELTELRTVAPLLREHDRAVEELQELADTPDLPEDARESRLTAEQALQRAKTDLKVAEGEIARCTEALSVLVIEAPLLEHADAIERLAARVETVARSRIEAQQYQAAIDGIGGELTASAARLAPGRKMEDILDGAPSDADRVVLSEHLSEIPHLDDRLEGYRNRVDELDKAAILEAEDSVDLPDVGVRHQLVAALRGAQGLGNTSQQLGDLEREIREYADDLTQTLWDLGVDTAEVLRRSRPLLASQITSARKTVDDIDEAIGKLRDEAQRLDADLKQQQLRKQEFAAIGEVVTAETLHFARGRRDEGWILMRQAYVERSHDAERLAQSFDPERPLPEAFEAAQEDADRQADLLRADAARAAGFEECTARISQMGRRQSEINEELAKLVARRRMMQDDWSLQLAEARLPKLDPDALREWQTVRESALDLDGRLERLRADHERLRIKEKKAAEVLIAALQAVGQAPHSPDLASLVDQASQWEKYATALEAKQEERTKSVRERRLEWEKVKGRIATTEAELQRYIDAVDVWHSRLFLDVGSAPTAVKARLNELDNLARRAAELRQIQLQQIQQQAVVDDFEKQAANLARLLDETPPELADDFAERLQRRLKASVEQEQQRLSLFRDLKRAEETKLRAETEQATQSTVLDKLCAAAGVATVTQLPECEEGATRKRQAQARLTSQRRQLTQASARSELELKERLADQDVIAIDAERDRCRAEIARLEQEQTSARQEEERARRALEAIDASDAAAKAREAMESAVARYQAAVRPWARLRLAHALLQESLKRFRERAQAPMVAAASAYFSLMTGGRYRRLVADEADDKPVLLAERDDDIRIGVEAMSEGTADQLYLALRLAALELRRDSHPQMPLVLDDVLITSDDERAANILRALARFAEGGQVMLFTHHRHLIELARDVLNERDFAVHDL